MFFFSKIKCLKRKRQRQKIDRDTEKDINIEIYVD